MRNPHRRMERWTLLKPAVPGDLTVASCMYLQAVLGLFQNARCMKVLKSSPARARDTAPPDLNECIVNSPGARAALALACNKRDIWALVRFFEPRIGFSSRLSRCRGIDAPWSCPSPRVSLRLRTVRPLEWGTCRSARRHRVP